MLFLLMVPVFMFVATTHRLLQLYAPSNLIVAYVRRVRPRLWLAGALLVLASCFTLGAAVASESASTGGPGWLHLLFLVAIFDAMKFLLLAITVLLRRIATVFGRDRYLAPVRGLGSQ